MMTNTVNIEINGKALTVPKGTTVMQAADEMNVSIPHFCWHPGLSVAGVCRFCMVKIDGVPKLQIACNTECLDGMKVDTLNSEVKEAHKWALEFHLINHPLDCPICDQAGECELQNYYMKVGKYDSQMTEKKVLKPKALDVGRNLVLDTERCILCSRCVRFEDEVTKTGSLGIFNRGDRAVIGTFPNKKIDHNYSYNLVDICPVGAFTAKDFRFKCRVWFLKTKKTICPGCSTGCNVNLYQNQHSREYFRLKPRFNKDVNGYWMCDKGRDMYTHLNASQRLLTPLNQGQSLSWEEINSKFKTFVDDSLKSSQVALVLTPQYTNEEYSLLLSFFTKKFPQGFKLFTWRNGDEEKDSFDGLLKRGDENPNSKGLEHALSEFGLKSTLIKSDFRVLPKKDLEFLYVFGPEIEASYGHFLSDLAHFSEVKRSCYFGLTKDNIINEFELVVPTLTFAEKTGSYTNYKGLVQKISSNQPVMPKLKALSAFFKV